MGNNPSKFDPTKLSKEDQEKLKEGKPLTPIQGVKIVRNPVTGKYEGIPREWVEGVEGFPVDVDMSKTV